MVGLFSKKLLTISGGDPRRIQTYSLLPLCSGSWLTRGMDRAGEESERMMSSMTIELDCARLAILVHMVVYSLAWRT
jgi:hypothetical protein